MFLDAWLSKDPRLRKFSEVSGCGRATELLSLGEVGGLEEGVDCFPGGKFIADESRRVSCHFGSQSLIACVPGNSSPASPRWISVVVLSTETTDRTGKTRSVASGLKSECLLVEAGNGGLPAVPEKIVKDVLLCTASTDSVGETVGCRGGGECDMDLRSWSEEGLEAVWGSPEDGKGL